MAMVVLQFKDGTGVPPALALDQTISGAAGDHFGYSVDIDSANARAIIGARIYDGGSTNEGRAYIYNASTGGLVHTLDNPGGEGVATQDQFGVSVCISGNYAAVGAPFDGDPISNTGKVYIFNVTTGGLLYTVNNPSPSADDRFGHYVRTDGTTLIVSAYNHSTAVGEAHLFNITTGAFLHTLNNPAPTANDVFAYRCDVDGNYAICGAQGDDAAGNQSGRAYIFNVTTGGLHQTLENPNAIGAAASDTFGYSVGISGNIACVGARDETMHESPFSVNAGRLYTFNVTTGALDQSIVNPNHYGTHVADQFSYSSAIDGNNIIAIAFNEDSATQSGAGVAYIIDATTGSVKHTIENPLTTGGTFFGEDVAINGNNFIIGSYSAGEVYIYSFT